MSDIPRSKVLVVDDRVENLVAMRAALRAEPVEIFEAISGLEGIEIAKQHEFAVILLDVQMPQIDGFETANRLRKLETAKTTPIIFVTAIHRSEEYERLDYVAGAVDYLFKPINVEILLAKVRVFVELQQKTFENQRQGELLRRAAVKEKENELLREALIARDEFLSVVSHELKTPLTPLLLQLQSFIDLFKNEKEATVSRDRLLRMLNSSEEQVGRLTRLVNELVDVSRLRNGNVELNRQRCELNVLIKNLLIAYDEQIRSSGSKLEVSMDETVVGNWDCFRIEQVLINLITNALKYGERKPIRIEVNQYDGDALITIEDNGIGIRQEDQERIFDRFERAVSSRYYGGLGLGLYISWQMVRLHGGKISVESRFGEGSKFKVRLPTQVQN